MEEPSKTFDIWVLKILDLLKTFDIVDHCTKNLSLNKFTFVSTLSRIAVL